VISTQLGIAVRKAGLARQLATIRLMEAELDRRVPRDTGRLRFERRATTVPTPTVIRTTIRYDTPYAIHTDRGPRAHVIRARNAKTLRFRGRSGRIVYRRQVFWRPGAGVAKNRGWFSKTVKRYGILLRSLGR